MRFSTQTLSIGSLFALSILLPLAAAGLDYSNATDSYDDAPFSRAEQAGISLLTNLEVVEGNPDGKFHPERTLNRAEFMKIAIGLYIKGNDDLFAGYSWYKNGSVRNNRCFPDVSLNDWFGMYVCEGKDLDVIRGYPDGLFHPEREVNYAEAVKILAEVFEYGVTDPGFEEFWYEPYMDAAASRGVLLPISLRSGSQLTRGQMARLAAAFRAESEGELEIYRAAELGEDIQNSSSRAVSSSSISSISSVSSSSSVSTDFPVQSTFLIAGERSDPIAGGTFVNGLEGMHVRGAEVRLEEEVTAIQAMYIVSEEGTQLGTLSLDVNDSEDRVWKGTFPAEGAYYIPEDEERVLGVEMVMKARNAGGVSEDLVQVENFKLTVIGEDTQTSYESRSGSLVTIVYPKHQTAFGEITAVRSTLPATNAFIFGPGQMLGSFEFDAASVSGTSVAIEQLYFDISKSSDVAVTNWQLGTKDSNERHGCSVTASQVECISIPATIGDISGTRVIRLFGNVTLGGSINPSYIQVTLQIPGSPESGGAVRWTDGTGHFSWVDLDQPVAQGTLWK